MSVILASLGILLVLASLGRLLSSKCFTIEIFISLRFHLQHFFHIFPRLCSPSRSACELQRFLFRNSPSLHIKKIMLENYYSLFLYRSFRTSAFTSLYYGSSALWRSPIFITVLPLFGVHLSSFVTAYRKQASQPTFSQFCEIILNRSFQPLFIFLFSPKGRFSISMQLCILTYKGKSPKNLILEVSDTNFGFPGIP